MDLFNRQWTPWCFYLVLVVLMVFYAIKIGSDSHAIRQTAVVWATDRQTLLTALKADSITAGTQWNYVLAGTAADNIFLVIYGLLFILISWLQFKKNFWSSFTLIFGIITAVLDWFENNAIENTKQNFDNENALSSAISTMNTLGSAKWFFCALALLATSAFFRNARGFPGALALRISSVAMLLAVLLYVGGGNFSLPIVTTLALRLVDVGYLALFLGLIFGAWYLFPTMPKRVKKSIAQPST